MKSKLILALCLLFLLQVLPFAATAAGKNPAKEGSKCSKLGDFSKKMQCISADGKLIWRELTLTGSSKKYPVENSKCFKDQVLAMGLSIDNELIKLECKWDEGKIGQFGHWTSDTWKSLCDSDPEVPKEWQSYQKFALLNFNCSRPLRFVDKSLPSDQPKSALMQKSDLSPISNCKIPDANTPEGYSKNIGHTSTWKFNGDLTIQIVPVQFTDFKAQDSPINEYGKYFTYLKDIFYKISDGNTRINFRIPNQYYDIKTELKSFDTGSFIAHDGGFKWRKLDVGKYQSAIFDTVDSQINFSGIKMNIIIVPLSVPDDYIAHSPTFRMDNVRTDEGIVAANYLMPPANMNSRRDWFGVEPFLHTHEFFHATGMLTDHLGDSESGGSFLGTGNWGNMSGMMMDHLTWDKWLAGMLADSQVICASNNSIGNYWIKPATYFGNFEKLLVIPISQSKVIAIESQRAAGVNFKLTKIEQGALVYTIDTSDNRHDGGMEVIRPASRKTNPRSGPFLLWDAPLKLYESVEVWGYKITVVESGKFGDVVKVEKV